MDHDQRRWFRIFDNLNPLAFWLGMFLVPYGLVSIIGLFFKVHFLSQQEFIGGLVLVLLVAYEQMYQNWKDNIVKQYKYKALLDGIEDVFTSKMFIDLYCSTSSFLGEKYRNSDATSFFERILHDGDCYSMKEAQEMYKKELATRVIEQKAENVERVIKLMDALVALALSNAEK